MQCNSPYLNARIVLSPFSVSEKRTNTGDFATDSRRFSSRDAYKRKGHKMRKIRVRL